MIRAALAILAGIVVLTVTSFAIEWVTDPVLARSSRRAVERSHVAPRRPKTDHVCVHDLVCGLRRICHGVASARFRGSARSDHGRDPDGVDCAGNDRVSRQSPIMVLDRGDRRDRAGGVVRGHVPRDTGETPCKVSVTTQVSSPPGRRGRHTQPIQQIISIPKIGRQTSSGLLRGNQRHLRIEALNEHR